jgi:hypothetical protein
VSKGEYESEVRVYDCGVVHLTEARANQRFDCKEIINCGVYYHFFVGVANSSRPKAPPPKGGFLGIRPRLRIKKTAAFRAESEANSTSEAGILPRVNRSIQVEGGLRGYQRRPRFRRFLTRGRAGVSGELFLVCFGYNVNKLHHKI